MTRKLVGVNAILGQRLSKLLLALTALAACATVSTAQDFNSAASQINQYLFNGSSQEDFERSQKEKGQARMRVLERTLGLNEQQKQKAELAIELDIANFLQEVDVVREKVKGLSPNNNDEWQKFWTHISPLYQRVQAGLFERDSLFQKVSKTILNDDQLAKMLVQEESNQRLLLEQSAYLAVTNLSTSMPLLADQQQQIVDLMIAHAEGKKFPMDNSSRMQFLQYALIGSLPIDKLPASFDKSQTTFLKKIREQYKSYGRELK